MARGGQFTWRLTELERQIDQQIFTQRRTIPVTHHAKMLLHLARLRGRFLETLATRGSPNRRHRGFAGLHVGIRPACDPPSQPLFRCGSSKGRCSIGRSDSWRLRRITRNGIWFPVGAALPPWAYVGMAKSNNVRRNLVADLAGRFRREAQKPHYAGHELASAEGTQRTVYLFVTGSVARGSSYDAALTLGR